MSPTAKQGLILATARELGFDRCGCAPAGRIERAHYYRRWLEAGRAGEMRYLHDHAAKRVQASRLLGGAKTVIVCALNYHQPLPPRPDTSSPARRTGRVAMYAWGDDYHKVVKAKLLALVDRLRQQIDEPFEAKVCVDTVPLVEREYAMLAGIGWIGKNTLLLNAQLGSYFVLGEVVTTLEVGFDQPAADRCGRCTRCLDACPTQALVGPYELDATRCISYLTIEHRSSFIPGELRPKMGNWVFGCDICQQVCPYNRDVPHTSERRFKVRPPWPEPDLDDMIAWTDEQYREVLAGSAIGRAKPDMLRRNARIALQNVAAMGPSEQPRT